MRSPINFFNLLEQECFPRLHVIKALHIEIGPSSEKPVPKHTSEDFLKGIGSSKWFVVHLPFSC